MARDAISSNATPCVYASNQHFLQNGVMTWSYTSDVGMMHLVIPFFLQIAVGDASAQVASLWEEKTQGTLGTPDAYGPWAEKWVPMVLPATIQPNHQTVPQWHCLLPVPSHDSHPHPSPRCSARDSVMSANSCK
jgi:hypothetical protein